MAGSRASTTRHEAAADRAEMETDGKMDASNANTYSIPTLIV
jgi:hypothetical protein